GSEATGIGYLRTLAIARIVLDNFDNLQASWVTQGGKVGQLRLAFGANDMGSVMIEENVVRAAGASFCMDEAEIVRNIEDAGFVAKRRNMHYEILGDPIYRERTIPRMLELATARADGDTSVPEELRFSPARSPPAKNARTQRARSLRTENPEPRTQNREPRTENAEPRTQNRALRTPNLETQNRERRTPNAELPCLPPLNDPVPRLLALADCRARDPQRLGRRRGRPDCRLWRAGAGRAARLRRRRARDRSGRRRAVARFVQRAYAPGAVVPARRGAAGVGVRRLDSRRHRGAAEPSPSGGCPDR